MTKTLWLAALGLLFYAIPSTAQCSMYTFQDIWLDDNGNLVAENYTEATCTNSSAYSTVNLTMPSGIQPGGFANGATTAEALTQSSTAGQTGDGLLSGDNQTLAACTASTFISFRNILSLGESFTWFQFASGATFNQMQPCPEPGHTISCTASQTVFTDPRDIEGLFVQFRRRFAKVFGRTLCSPLASHQAWQNTAPDRPYCYDLP